VKTEHLSIHVALKTLHHFLNAALSNGVVALDFRLLNYFRPCENGQQVRASVFKSLYMKYIQKPHSCKPMFFEVCILLCINCDILEQGFSNILEPGTPLIFITVIEHKVKGIAEDLSEF